MPEEKKGQSVLLIEDEAMISLDLCDTLHDAGCDVIGPAKTAADVLVLRQQRMPDAAMIDLPLRHGTSTPLPRRLRRQDAPFPLYAGDQQTDDLIAPCPGAAWLAKPSDPDQVIECLAGLSSRPHVTGQHDCRLRRSNSRRSVADGSASVEPGT